MTRLHAFRAAYRARPRWQHVTHLLATAWLPFVLSIYGHPVWALVVMSLLGALFFLAFPLRLTASAPPAALPAARSDIAANEP